MTPPKWSGEDNSAAQSERLKPLEESVMAGDEQPAGSAPGGNDQQRRPGAGETREPRGFGEHTRGLPGEYAHEQGWGLDEEERRRRASSPTDMDGGSDYNYSARDFGDEPVNMSRAVERKGEREEQAAREALGIDNPKEQK